MYKSFNANKKNEIYKIVMLPLFCTSGKLCLLSHRMGDVRKIAEEVVWTQGGGSDGMIKKTITSTEEFRNLYSYRMLLGLATQRGRDGRSM
jgi:hypothetical protein